MKALLFTAAALLMAASAQAHNARNLCYLSSNSAGAAVTVSDDVHGNIKTFISGPSNEEAACSTYLAAFRQNYGSATALATQLRDAGECSVIIDNVDLTGVTQSANMHPDRKVYDFTFPHDCTDKDR